MSSTDLLGLFRSALVVLFDEPAALVVGGLRLVASFGSEELLGDDCPPIDFGVLKSDRIVLMPFDSGLLLPGFNDPPGIDLEMPFGPGLVPDGAPLELLN